MPPRLEAPVLQVDANVIHKVDTTNVQNLFSMWTVFARCADSVAQGRRLENLSWRLWTRETFCVDNNDAASTASTASLPRSIQHSESNSTEDIPQLSGSVDSVADEEAVDFSAQSAPMEVLCPRILRQDSCASSRSRGKERHITSDDLEKIVASIVQQKETLNAPLPEIASSYNLPQPEHKEPVPTFERSGSTTTESPSNGSDAPSFESPHQPSSPEIPASRSKTTVVRGFSPSQMPACRSIQTPHKTSSDDSMLEPQPSIAPKLIQPKKQPKFALGGSSCEDSMSDQAYSLDLRKQPVPPPKLKMFQVGGSPEEGRSLKSAMNSSRNSLLTTRKKQASFSNQLVTRVLPAPAVIDEPETEDIDESAIDDDDDSSDWEDLIHIKSIPRTSLITIMLAQKDRQKKLGSQTRSARQPPSQVASPFDSDKNTANQAASSPRTTRRNMLSTELTESLRRHLLWERLQKSSTANAVLKSRHTSNDVANLKQYPEKVYINKDTDASASSLDEYFNIAAENGYHYSGW